MAAPNHPTDSTRILSRAPFAHLADAVCAGHLDLAEARRQVTAWNIRWRVNEADVDRYSRATLDLALQDLPRAITLAELNCTIAQRIGARPILIGNCWLGLGWLYREQETIDLSLEAYRQALQIFTDHASNPAMVATIRRDLGGIYERQGRLGEALAEYAAMERLAVELGRADLQADALCRQGLARLNQGEIEEALVVLGRAIQLSAAPDLALSRALALSHRGMARQQLGQVLEGEADLREALRICAAADERERQSGAPPLQRRATQDQLVRHRGDLGSLLLAAGRLAEAETELNAALQLAQQTANAAGVQRCHTILGSTYRAMARRRQGDPARRLDQALDHHRRAVERARAARDERNLSAFLLNLGNDYAALAPRDGDQGHDQPPIELARACYDEALALAERHDLGNIRWRVAYAQGTLRELSGEDAAAYACYRAAIAGAEAQRGQIKDIELRRHLWHDRAAVYQRAALCCLRLDRPDLMRALAHAEQARARYLNDRLGPDGWRADQLADPQQGTLESRAAADIAAIRAGLAPGAAVVVFTVTELGTLVVILTGPPAEGARAPADPAWIGQPDERIWARHIAEFDQEALIRLLIDTDAEGQLRGGYLVDYYGALQVLGSSADIEAKRAAYARAEQALTSVIAAITAALLREVERALAALRVTQLTLMPNLGLGLLPLHAAFPDTTVVRYAPSFRLLRHSRERRAQARPGGAALFVDNPTGDLPWASIEVYLIARQIAATYGHTVLGCHTRDRATPEAFLAAAPKHQLIHLACHGHLNLRDPLRSALSLAASEAQPGQAPAPPRVELLTLERLLDGLRLPDTHLVVMSACETGMIDPGNLADEYFSLPAGFLMPGCPTVLASLWAVPDLSTALLTAMFYQQVLTNHQEPAAALKRAQIWLRDLTLGGWEAYNAGLRTRAPIAYVLLERERRRYQSHLGAGADPQQHRPFAHPYAWAAFTVVGA